MLPFLKPKMIAGLIISKRKADGAPQEQHSEGQENQGLETACGDFIRAVHGKDERAAAAALSAAWELLQAGVTDEGSAEAASPHTFAAQNIKAAKSQG